MYRLLFTLLLRHIDPERAHALAAQSLRALRATPAGRTAIAGLIGSTDPRLEVRALGLTFASPLGVAAGLDKGASWFADLAALGFGFVEVGTLTAVPQAGNPRPRIARLTQERALLNRLGFPNPGAEIAAARLERRREQGIVGVNVGKSRSTPIDAAASDLRGSVRRLAPVSDYLVINVSSPNTPGLRELQSAERLGPLITEIRDELSTIRQAVPLLIKVSPDLTDGELDQLAQLALELELDGIVAVNTTVDRAALGARGAPFEGGGVSGPPLRSRSLEVLRRLHATCGERLVLISVGGIETAEDVWERIRAGATLVQAYTGFVYGGPAWPRRINRELARKVREAGASSIGDLVGVGRAGP